MLGIQVRHPRFNLYHLDEGEMFIKEFASTCQFVYPETEKVEQLAGVILIGSRSIIFEPDDHNYSIVKFHFRNITDRPKIMLIEGKDIFKLTVNKMITVPHGQIVQPYKTFPIRSDVYIHFLFEKIDLVAQVIYELFEKYNSKTTVFDFDSIEYLGNLYNFNFDYTRIKSINEKILLKSELMVKQLLPLVEVPGLLMVTDTRIYFQPLFTLNTKKCFNIRYVNITKLFKRRTKLREIGLEICYIKRTKEESFLLQCESENDRDMLFDLFNSYTPNTTETNFSIDKYTKLWVEGSMTNYEYLIALNSAANRTRNDLSHYPVFPWVLSNYFSESLDLNEEKNFRDLSKPIGALEKKRLEVFKERYRQMPEPKFLYGTHYSNPGYVIGYLVRRFPQYMIKLHGGRYDHPDRLFNSIEIDWEVCLTNPGSLKELIPEFYEDNSDFLENKLNLDLGLTSKNEKIGNVNLPKWSQNANDFLMKMREALESTHVSSNLHNWIDLIFGYKQRGQNAIDSDNLFHHLTYEESVDVEKIEDPISKNAIEMQVNEYGQTPKQLFKVPHPKRFSKFEDFVNEEEAKEKVINITSELKEIVIESDNNTQFIEDIITDNTHSSLVTGQMENLSLEKDREVNLDFNRSYTPILKFHKKKVTSSVFQGEHKTFITGSEDGFIKIYDYKSNKTKRMFNIGNFPITTITNLNPSTTIAIGSTDNMVHIFNTSLGKELVNFYAHEDSIVRIFHNPNNNCLITDGADSTCKVWDLSNSNKIPLMVYYDTESQIISADFRAKDNLHLLIDQDGYLVLRNLKEQHDLKKIQLKKQKYNFVKFNILNDYQYFVGGEDSFKIFDIRTHLELDSIEEFANSIDIFNDTSSYLLVREEGLTTYSKNSKDIINNCNDFGPVSHVNINCVNFQTPDIFLVGTKNGDIFISNLKEEIN